ncbi:hypothetical protein VNO80_29210 [Phaseolus coccineus]|uniref:Uncharacterized protein n=1 Tax=Phaseolus coccineus TaxID=3886 RepID=A0AAN9LDY6_PHACN
MKAQSGMDSETNPCNSNSATHPVTGGVRKLMVNPIRTFEGSEGDVLEVFRKNNVLDGMEVTKGCDFLASVLCDDEVGEGRAADLVVPIEGNQFFPTSPLGVIPNNVSLNNGGDGVRYDEAGLAGMEARNLTDGIEGGAEGTKFFTRHRVQRRRYLWELEANCDQNRSKSKGVVVNMHTTTPSS